MNTVDFGKFVSELRKEKGLTQRQLAEMLNVTDKAVSRWEKGKNYPDIETLESLSTVFGISVSELLEGKRLCKDELISVSESQVVEQIKSNRKISKIYRIIISVILIFALISGYIALKESGVFDGVIYRKIDCYSNDILTILNNVDGYISQRPKAEGDYIVNNGWIFIEPDKTTNDILYLSGTCENGRYFYVNTDYDEQTPEDSCCFIGEFRENQEPVQGFSIDELKAVVAKLDFSSLDKYEKYELNIDSIYTYDNKDLCSNDYQSGIQKFLFSKGTLQQYTQKTITGKYGMLIITGYNGAYGETVAYIFVEK